MNRLMISIAAAVLLLISASGVARADNRKVDEDIKATWASVAAGHTNDAIARAAKLMTEIDPAQDDEGYWRSSSTLVEILQELEADSVADKILGAMAQKKIAETQPSRRVWMQYYVARDLVRLGQKEQGVQILKAVTANDERQVYFPVQRSAAILMSKIEFDAENIEQSAIWMRRAVLGILMNKDAAPADILSVLTEYAAHLALTRRPLDALALYARLQPIYKVGVPKHSPLYIHFAAEYLQTLTTVGSYAAADRALADLKEAVTGVDVLPPSISATLLYEDLYQVARSGLATGENPLSETLKKLLTAESPDYLKLPENRIAFSYLALLVGDYQLADEYARASGAEQSESPQIRADGMLLQSFVAAGQKDFPTSLTLAREGTEQLQLFLRRFEALSSDWSPMLRGEERLGLGAILGVNAGKVASAKDKDTLFLIAQLLNSDRSKLGLTARISRHALKLDLQREDLRTRDRLRDTRDRLMDDSVRTLITRSVTPPAKDQSSSQQLDTAPMQRLEEIEDKIAIADQEVQGHNNVSQEFLTNVQDAQNILRPNEALVLHNVTPLGIAQICIVRDRTQIHFEPVPADKAKQVGIDEKVILAAVHAEYAPSPTLDESFPSESAYRLYTLLFGGIADCIRNKTHILLATDPNLFAFPFNALLTAPAARDVPFSNRYAAWLPKSFAISLLPSVNAIYELRVNASLSQARQKFLGVGDPELQGPRQPGTQLSLRSLYVERGVANLTALKNLPPLPESVNELRVVSSALGASADSVLLGRDATERSLRNRPLNDYRVISFATHALVAGDIEGISEPALVLTPGSEATPTNDGLLTATEIANLDLDANLVILSACNTAAADGAASGRGLSGLANAFFFAGARSVAVTQWAVFSEVAQTLGAALITRSTGPDGQGVAEALRRTMVDYISGAKEDYRAHPRFWAAFTIAGDGAIKPLDGRATDELGGEALRLENDRLTLDASQQEFLGVAKLPATGTIYAVGRLKPAPGTSFAGSYLARLKPAGGADIVSVDPAIAAGPISTVRNGIILLENTYSQDRKSAALFRLMDNNGRELWRFSEDGPLDDIPAGAVDVPKGYVLVSTAEDWSSSPTPSPSKLILNLVSPSGELLSRHEYVVADRSLTSNPPALVVKGKNNDLIVVINKLRTPAEENLPLWIINPLTGSRRVCLGGNMTTFLDIDIKTLKIRSTADTHDRVAKSVKMHNGNIFVAFSTARECRLQHGIELAKINEALQPETVLKYEGVNDLQLWDFASIGNSFVLSGSVQVQLPTTLLREVITLDQLTHPHPFDPSFWEKGEDQPNAFVLIGNADGTVLGDRVFPDMLNRSINGVVVSGPRQIVGVGAALGDRGWMVVLEPNTSLGDRAGH